MIPRDLDVLTSNVSMLKALGLFAQDVIGASTAISGLACSPSSPAALSVQIGLGRIYSPQVADAGAYGSLPADSTSIIKQGMLAAPVTLSTPAPIVAGQSIAYLVEVQYQDVDANSTVLAYFNSLNPLAPLSGAGGSGVPQATQRMGIAAVQVKAGTSAVTGTQVTPSVDAGWAGIWVVTVAFGAASVVAGNIAQYPAAPFLTFSALTALTQANADLRYLQLYFRTAAEITAGVVPTNFSINSDLLDPRRYGAAGDGTTDDTAAINRCIAVINATANPVSTWPVGLKFLCAPLTTITANNFTWNMSSTLLVKPNTWGITAGTATNHLTIAGNGCRMYSLTLNGNQAGFTGASPFGQMLYVTGNDVLMNGCSLTQSPSGIMQLNNVVQGRFANCKFDNNVNSVTALASSYLKFVNSTFNLNGYPFGTAVTPGVPNAAGGFGVALRFRSHHIEFTNCEALQNCRDGINVNQGSYAIKFANTIAWMNGDGGLTIAADNQATGRLGEGESCYDLEYMDCESYNNWGCGLVAYAPCYNVTVDGGRYYNNHRLAGTITEQSSFFSGIYFSGGSLGIRVRAKAYDDRQLCIVTGTTGTGPYTVSATGWVPGSMGNYPRVVVYNAAKQFSGFGTIVSESAGQVVITPSITNAFVGALAAGYFVSQRVQHNGCFFDNNCTGTMDIDGFGFLPGVFSFSGFKSMSAYTAGGQNVLLPASTIDTTELLANPSFDAGTGSGVSWTYNLPGGGAANPYSTAGANLRSPGALQLVGGTSPATGDSTLITNGLNYPQGAWVEASMWVSSVNAGDASIALLWNPGTGSLATVVNHPGGGWKQLKIGGFIPAGSTSINVRVTSAIGTTNYFDNGSLRVKSDSYDSRDFTYPTRNLAA